MGLDLILKFSFPLGALAAILISWAMLSAIHLLLFKRKKRTGPEESAADQAIECARMKARITLGAVLASPIVLGGGCIVALVTDNVLADLASIALLGAGGIALWVFAILRWRISIRRLKEVSWYYAAQKMVEESVAPLTPRGHMIFRDITVDDLSIDHLIVGPKGVFVLQTLVRSVSIRPNQLQDTTVTYDGRTLFFPSGQEHSSVDQATACAEKLSQWLSEHLDAPIAARAIIALPGWQVKRISAEGISVINPSQMEALFQYIKARPLSEQVIKQIVDHIELHVKKMQSPLIDTPSDQAMTCGS